jgi:hypothetical protein
MPIKNRGLFNLTDVTRRQIETDWPAANTNYDLYIKDLVANGNILASNITVNRITSNVWNNIYTANVIESPSNLYFTNSRVVSALIAGNNITIESNGRISSTSSGSDLSANTTSDLAEGSNLYYSNDRVQAYLNISGYQTAENILANVSVSNLDLSGNTTSDLAEGLNLYYTNARVVSALVAGDNITIESNGRISANNLVTVVNDSTSFLSTAGNLTYSIGKVVGDSRNILVIVEGLIQIPETDYTVNGANITFLEQPPVGTNVEVRFFGTESFAYNQTTGNLIPDIDSVRSLGSLNRRYKDLYLTGNTIVLGNLAISSFDGLLSISPVVNGNIVVANSTPTSLTAGEGITIEANGRISAPMVIMMTDTTIYANTLIPEGKNGLSVGPINIVAGANVTVTTGQRWVII